jgi:hypothetical protein
LHAEESARWEGSAGRGREDLAPSGKHETLGPQHTFAAFAQGSRPPAAPTSAAADLARPLWNELDPAQREALAPLASRWDTFDADRKQKWIEVAAKYPNLSSDGKRRLHARMAEFAKLTPQQRNTLRENFKKAYELPADQRQAVLQEFKELPPEERAALRQKADQKKEPPRRPTRDLSDRTAKSTAERKSEPASPVK